MAAVVPGRFERIAAIEVADVETGDSADNLPRISVNANWKLPSSRLPHLLVHDLGPSIEEVTQNLIDRIRSDHRSNVVLAMAAEMENRCGVQRPLRIAHQFQKGHISTTDAILYTEGSDLYVRIGCRARTLLTYLRMAMNAAIFVIALVLAFQIYITASGARTAWIKDYASKHASLYYGSDQSVFMTRRLVNGWYVLDWNRFHEIVWNDPTLIDDVHRAVKGEANRSSQHMAELGESMAQAQSLLSSMQLTARGPYIIQTIADNLLYQHFGEGTYFIWWDTNRPVPLTIMGLSTYSDREYAWTQTELLNRDLPQRIVASFSEYPDIASRIAAAFDESITYHEPWSITKLVREDPRSAMFNFSMPAMIAFGVIGFFVWRIPKAWLRFPCRLLGWMTPDDFNSQVVARNAWVERTLSKTLAEMGVGRTQITELGGGSTDAVQ